MRYASARFPVGGLLLAISLVGAPSSGARAEDWLAHYPECAFGPRGQALGHMALVYPAAGFPALVSAGDRLVTRVRVPSGLTPPPGIQQDRALRGWSAALLGTGHRPQGALGGPVAHRYAMRVVDVRPDGASSLVYRATVVVPAWAAPGTYALEMSAPGGRDSVGAAVRVIARGAEPRLFAMGPFPDGTTIEDARAMASSLAAMPVDALLAPDSDLARRVFAQVPVDRAAAAVMLLPRPGLPAVLRGGSELLVLGACDSPFASFDEQLAGLVEAEGLEIRRLSFGQLPAQGDLRSMGDAGVTLSWPAANLVQMRVEGRDLHVRVREGATPAELTILVPDDGRSTTVTHAAHAFWPATPVVSMRSVPTLALGLRIAPGVDAVIRRGEASPVGLEVGADPERARTGQAVAFSAEATGPATVAWQLHEEATAVGPTARHKWTFPGTYEVHALAIAEDGTTARDVQRIDVVTADARGCGTCVITGAGAGRPLPLEVLLLALLLLERRRRRRRGNRSGALGR